MVRLWIYVRNREREAIKDNKDKNYKHLYNIGNLGNENIDKV